MIPGLDITKSWQHINYEKTGHLKKGKPPKWYNILTDHIANNLPLSCPTSSTNSHKPLSHKRNKLQWTYDFSRYGEISFGRIIKKAQPTRNSQTIFYSHWLPIDSTHENYTVLHNNNNAQLIQCQGCNKGISGSLNCTSSATCIIKCTAKNMGRIDHVKITKTQSSINMDDTKPIAHFPVHIQFFFNLPQTRRFRPASPNITITSTESPITPEIHMHNSLEISLISRATNNTIIQKQLTDLFHNFSASSLPIIEIYTDGSLAENKSSGQYEMGSGWISVENNCSFYCSTKTWPSSTRAELLAIYTALLTLPLKQSVSIKTDSQAAIDGIRNSRSYTAHNKWLSVNNRNLLNNIAFITNFKSLQVEYIKVKAHSGIEGNELADSLANQGRQGPHFDANLGIFPKATFSPFWNGISIEMPIRKFIKDLNQTLHQAS